ncbi:Teneurin-4 [Varanus komodoensis]|nr:Teneurin-4 [Varanus komodoensis]
MECFVDMFLKAAHIFKMLFAAPGKPSSFFPEDSFIDSGEIDVGRRATQKIPPSIFWRSQVFIDHPVHLKFNVSLGKSALVGIYGRKGLPPSHTQFDFVELLDGRRLLTQEARGLEGPQRQHKGIVPLASHETGFIQYLDSGMWHLAFYNDGKESEVVSFLTTAIGSRRLLVPDLAFATHSVVLCQYLIRLCLRLWTCHALLDI